MGYSNSPRVIKGGLLLLDPATSRAQRVIPLQYNPDTLTRTLQVQAAGGEAGNRSEAMRFKGPAIETLRLEAEIDATDPLEFPGQNQAVLAHGIQPHLAALELLAHPSRKKPSVLTLWPTILPKVTVSC